MSRTEMHERLARLYDKLNFHCYGLFDAMNRYGDPFDWLDKCRAYKRAIDYLWTRLD